MGVKVSTLAKRVEKAQIRVGEGEEDVVNVEFRPGSLTLGTMDKLANAAAIGQFDPSAIEEVLHVLVSWDLLDDDGSPLPLTREGLHKLPMEFVGELVSVLGQNASVEEEAGKASDVTSQQTVEQVASPSGTSSSVQPVTST